LDSFGWDLTGIADDGNSVGASSGGYWSRSITSEYTLVMEFTYALLVIGLQGINLFSTARKEPDRWYTPSCRRNQN
jgi:hypothetical protein